MTKRQFIIRQKNKLLRIKLDLEKPFANGLIDYFRNVNREILTGDSLHTIRPVLKRHQGRVIDALLHKKKSIDYIRIINDLFTFNEQRIAKTATQIDKYTNDLINRSVELARQQLQSEGVENPSLEIIRKVTVNIFRNYSKSRIKEIAITETNGLFESTRRQIVVGLQPYIQEAINDQDVDELEDIYGLTESWDIYNILNQIEESSEDGLTDEERNNAFMSFRGQTKTWMSMGDDKVRQTHIEAEGQEQLINEPFIIGEGYLLQYPGDWTLGAPPEEICNCRCSVGY